MTEKSPAPSRWSGAVVGLLIIGLLLIIGPGSCAVSTVEVISDPAGAALGWLAIFICAPLVAGGLGFTVLALSRVFGEPGKPPIWRVATGWLLVIFAAAYALYPVWDSMKTGWDFGTLAFGMVMMLAPAVLVGWLGLTLARPKR